jgi:Thiamine pyrophosphate-requiring enzymes [acetolactate synthase, pyruvate dehydrogenase (cytochrome), glyoxylate carboligase, phosphonopyruvate decarboxylase]
VPAAAAIDVARGLDPRKMNRLEATRRICEVASQAAIIASLGHPAYDLFAVEDRPRNFYTWGSMGLASSIGLGLALARPDLNVIVSTATDRC